MQPPEEGMASSRQHSRRRTLAQVSAALSTGALTVLAFPEHDLWGLAWLSLLPLAFVLRLHAPSPRRALLLGWLAGATTNLGGFFWVVHLLRVFGHLPWPAAVALYALLSAYQGLVYGLWALALRTLEPRLPRVPAALLGALLFVAAELTVPFLFPWYLGNSQYRATTVLQMADLVGVPGISLLLALAGCSGGALLADLLRAGRARRPLGSLRSALATAVATLALVGCALGYGAWRIPQVQAAVDAAPRLRVALVEGNIGIREKARPEHVANNLAIYQRLSVWAARRGAELIVWPESAYDAQRFRRGQRRIAPSQRPLWPDERWEALPASGDHLILDPLPLPTDRARDAATTGSRRDGLAPQRGFTTPLLLGAVTWEPDPEPRAPGRRWRRKVYNSALLLDEEGRLDGRLYDKNRLLVFGEYLPLGRSLPLLYRLVPEASAFEAGEDVTVFEWERARIAVMICYEAILPRFARRYGPPRPNLLVTLTNDAWFGPLGEPWLHLALTVPRAVEHRTALVRSTNTGVSAFVDPIGRLGRHSSVEHAEVLLEDVPLLELPPTVYERFGWAFDGLVLAVALGLLVLGLRRRPSAASEPLIHRALPR